MLDERVYRVGLVVVLVAIVVAALSLRDGSTALTTTLALDAFNLGAAGAALGQLAAVDGRLRPGSAHDRRTAAIVAGRLSADGFTVASRSVAVPTDSRPRVGSGGDGCPGPASSAGRSSSSLTGRRGR
jgi:hypothetical protein